MCERCNKSDVQVSLCTIGVANQEYFRQRLCADCKFKLRNSNLTVKEFVERLDNDNSDTVTQTVQDITSAEIIKANAGKEKET